MKTDALRRRRSSWNCLLLILATVFVTCVPVLASDYGYADDFWFLSMRPLNNETISNTVHHFNAEGRALFSIWALGVMGQADGIQGLRLARFLALFGIFFSSVVFYKLIRRHLAEDRLDAALAACIFSINPSFLIMAGWAQAGSDAYACFMGLLSSHLLLGDERFDAPSAKKDAADGNRTSAGSGLERLILSSVLLFASLSLYQPAAMLYWTGAAIWIIGRFAAQREDWVKLARIGALFVIVLGAYLLFVSAFADPNSRFHASLSLVRRMGWFVLYPLQNALCYPSLEPFPLWSIAALLILSLGIWLYCRQTARTMWIPPLVLSFTPLTMLPTMFAYSHYDVSRTRTALYALIIVLWCITFKAVSRFLNDSFKPRHILIPVLILLIVSSQYQLQRYFITPQLWEEAALLVKLQEYVHENPKLDRLIVIWPPPTYPPITEFEGVDEFGFASLSRPAASTPEIKVFLAGITNQKYEDLPNIKIETIYTTSQLLDQHIEIPSPDAFYIDFRQLRSPR